VIAAVASTSKDANANADAGATKPAAEDDESDDAGDLYENERAAVGQQETSSRERRLEGGLKPDLRFRPNVDGPVAHTCPSLLCSILFISTENK
jgi:hypothetical protein